jgi:hypothetical protein
VCAEISEHSVRNGGILIERNFGSFRLKPATSKNADAASKKEFLSKNCIELLGEQRGSRSELRPDLKIVYMSG